MKRVVLVELVLEFLVCRDSQQDCAGLAIAGLDSIVRIAQVRKAAEKKAADAKAKAERLRVGLAEYRAQQALLPPPSGAREFQNKKIPSSNSNIARSENKSR
jgi:hypothetical protein